jgi:hypothetical protein
MHKKTVNKHRTSGSSEQQILRISEFPSSNLGPEIGYPTVSSYFIFMWPCIVIDFFLNNQPDALIIHICYKTLHVSGILSAHHQEFPTVHSATGKFHAGFWWPFPSRLRIPSWLCLETVIKNLHETYQCWMYSRELLMMGKEDARNM